LNAPIDGLHLRTEGGRTYPEDQDNEKRNSSGKNRHGGSWFKISIVKGVLRKQRLSVTGLNLDCM
jgi:hypothetical protein